MNHSNAARCAICPGDCDPVMSIGPAPCRYLFVGDAPGFQESAYGEPFVGDAGDELTQTYMALAGLRRAEVHITNSKLCKGGSNRAPSAAEVSGCAAHHLPQTIAAVEPEIVFLLGSAACKLAGLNLMLEHGVPQLVEDFYGWCGWVVPMYHPASGLHNTTMMSPQLEDWARLRPWLEQWEWQWPEDNYPTTDYRLVRNVDDFWEYIFDYADSVYPALIGADTESHAGVGYSRQISVKPGTGMMILDEDRLLTQTLGSYLSAVALDPAVRLAYHYAPADADMFDECAGRALPYIDTIQEAYQLSRFAKLGLKNLGYRLFGVRMRSWQDVVTEPSKAVLFEWMEKAAELVANEYPIVERRYSKSKRNMGKELMPKCSRTKTETRLYGIYRSMITGAEDYDPWEKLSDIDWGENERILTRVRGEFGTWPSRGIRHVAVDDQVEYACMDADITLRLAIELERCRAMEQIEVYKGDWDV
jgi:uracil-DNA glycosylase family 4